MKTSTNQELFYRLNKYHEIFMLEVNNYLKEQGFTTENLSYHDNSSHSIIQMLQHSKTQTADYLRHRADRFAIHKDYTKIFIYDIKSGKGNDFMVDIEQLLQYKSVVENQYINFLYFYHNIKYDYSVAFSMKDALNNIRDIWVPSVNGNTKKEWIKEYINTKKKIYKKAFPDIPIRYIYKTKGSGDPFCVIPQDWIKKQLYYKDFIKLYLNRQREVIR